MAQVLVAVAVLVVVVSGRRLWRRFWLGVEDPRPMAALRIGLGLVVLADVDGLYEHFVLLFCDEGMFPAAAARRVYAAHQFAGFGDGVVEPWGFFDLAAVVRFATGPRFSLLYFWDTPLAMWLHLAAFNVVALAFVLGAWTRGSGIATLVLMHSTFDRAPLFWEGTEVVLQVFLTMIVVGRCGEAWSIDALRRRRRVGVDAPVYRAIPAWPRRLVMLQLAIVYVTTGALKYGAVWNHGDAIYYALNLDHFHRVPLHALTAALGTNVLRIATWFVHVGEIGFGLVFVGELVRTGLELRPHPRTRRDRMLAWIRAWLLGRRIWLTWATAIMLGIFLTMNIGMFQPAMLVLSLAYLRPQELAWVQARVTRRPPIPAVVDPARLAYGPIARFVTGAWLAWHITAVVIWLLPELRALEPARKTLRETVRPYLQLVRAIQGWGMFAPNPPRANVFMRVVVTDEDGTRWDMQSDVYADARRSIPFVWNDRMRKINRRIIGGESGGGEWYRKWYARWQCRQWALDHDGRVPRSVELVKLWYRIPTPEQMHARGWYRPEDRLRTHGQEEVVYTERCATAVLGQPSPEIAARHGVTSSVEHRPWNTPRRAKWDAR